MIARLRARLAQEEGMTLIELLTTMAILGLVLTAIVGMFVSGLNAEVDMNNRFQAQQNARLALTSLRNEIGSACSVSVLDSGASLQLGEQCNNGVAGSTVYWCAASSSGTKPFNLYRQTTPCASGITGTQHADMLACAGTTTCTTPAFQAAGTTGQRPEVTVTFPVEANLTNNNGLYTLTDTIMARNAPVL